MCIQSLPFQLYQQFTANYIFTQITLSTMAQTLECVHLMYLNTNAHERYGKYDVFFTFWGSLEAKAKPVLQLTDAI